MTINVKKKLEKIANFVQKNAKFRDVKMLTTIRLPIETVQYSIRGVSLTLRAEKLKTTKIFKRIENEYNFACICLHYQNI